MEVYKKGRLILLVLLVFTISSCAGGRGSFRRVKGHKVWIPGKRGKLKGRYERCYNFSL